MYRKIKIFTFVILVLVAIPQVMLAHQPRITESRRTIVTDPEISKAYYGQLTGEPDVYIIESDKNFNLYVGVLVPDAKGQKQDVSAVVLKDDNQVALLDGMNFTWQKFYEPFGADNYLAGPEYEADVDSGKYEIRVWSSNNDSKYSLAIGKIEAFDGKEGINALTVIPKLKQDFFGSSPISFIKSPFGWGMIVAMYILSLVFLIALKLINKFLIKKISPTQNNPHHNIGRKDRIIRLVLGIGLLALAINTTWNPILIFFSGFCMFEALFSWCGFYSLIGRNTCPTE